MMEHEDEAIEAESDVRIFPSPLSFAVWWIPAQS